MAASSNPASVAVTRAPSVGPRRGLGSGASAMNAFNAFDALGCASLQGLERSGSSGLRGAMLLSPSRNTGSASSHSGTTGTISPLVAPGSFLRRAALRLRWHHSTRASSASRRMARARMTQKYQRLWTGAAVSTAAPERPAPDCTDWSATMSRLGIWHVTLSDPSWVAADCQVLAPVALRTHTLQEGDACPSGRRMLTAVLPASVAGAHRTPVLGSTT
mmetsp:Transcript_38463/g.68841  ORF Transcript_38463/g.68841 Transcript_38463/m.68841 type:complete len:218 (+) Transcript_38463:2845-3498(+)